MTTLKSADLERLRNGFSGDVLLPGNDAYEGARKIWNAMVDKRPAVIARCAGVSDVVRAVGFARETGLELAVRGGGHNIAGSALSDGGIVVDLSRMKSTQVDPRARRVTVEGGRHPGRPRRRDPGARPGDAGRHQFDHRRRRPHPGRRLRLAQPQVRHDHRQPGIGRGRHRRRRRGARQRHRAPRSLLGAARRRRQLRRGDALRVPPASGGPQRAQRPDRLPGFVREGGAAPVPRDHRQGAGRADRLDRAAQGASAAVPARERSWPVGPRARGAVRRRPQAGRAADRAAAPAGYPSG